MDNKPSVETTLQSVRGLIGEAYRALNSLHSGGYPPGDEWMPTNDISAALGNGFQQLTVLAEALGLQHLRKAVSKAYRKARKSKGGLYEHVVDPDGDPHLIWLPSLKEFVNCFEAVYGMTRTRAIRKDLESILRETEYAITNKDCFPGAPAEEADVHKRIEMVLRCYFPDLQHPALAKPIKNFIPDTGIPSIRTLIEYKFLKAADKAGPMADEILADTRGYVSADWDTFVYVIYETHRFRTETEWNDLLKACGTAVNTQAIVLCGEPPPPKPADGKAKTDKAD
jgi:hypothetical protein